MFESSHIFVLIGRPRLLLRMMEVMTVTWCLSYQMGIGDFLTTNNPMKVVHIAEIEIQMAEIEIHMAETKIHMAEIEIHMAEIETEMVQGGTETGIPVEEIEILNTLWFRCNHDILLHQRLTQHQPSPDPLQVLIMVPTAGKDQGAVPYSREGLPAVWCSFGGHLVVWSGPAEPMVVLYKEKAASPGASAVPR